MDMFRLLALKVNGIYIRETISMNTCNYHAFPNLIRLFTSNS